MMKRHSELYKQIYDFANLEIAYRKARKCKRYRSEVLGFTANKEENLIELQNHLIWHSYTQGRYRVFTVIEPKKRTISALPFKDRVVQHAINNIIEPIFDKRFYYHSYACRAGKGMHAASETLTHWIRNLSFEGATVYALKADISKYFQSISHDRLKQATRRIIKDKEVLWLLDLIIDSNGEDHGIPVGNLTSQLFANLYLDALDRYVKETLRVRHYIRYMDDFIILSRDKKELQRLKEDIEGFLVTQLALRFNPKTAIISEKNGIDFCGYRHWRDYKKVRKGSVQRMNKKIRAFRRGKMSAGNLEKTIKSWEGHIKHADAYLLKEKIFRQIEEVKNRRREEREV